MSNIQGNSDKSFFNDLEIKLVIIERNTAQYKKEQLDKLILELQSKEVIVEKKPEPKQPVTQEIPFNLLTWETIEGAKLGSFEKAYKDKNDLMKWQSAFNVLNVNKATIENRYHQTGFQYSYWLFNQIMFRQKLKEA